MSLSLPHTHTLPTPHLPIPGIAPTAAVTRILVLSDFSPSLKTRDLQAVFQAWEGERGGFRVKWIDDVTALVVFGDALVAKRAYLSLLLNPAPALPYPATIKPYDGPDAQAIIHSVTARQHGHAAGGRSSMSGAGAGVMSGSMGQGIMAGHSMAAGGSQGIAGYPAAGHARTGSRVQQQQQQQPPMEMMNNAMTGLGISGYTKHGRSASTSSASASEPMHGGARNTGGDPYAGGAGRVGGAGHARHGSSGSSAFGRNSAMGAFSFGGSSLGKDASRGAKDTNVPAASEAAANAAPPPVASSAAFRSSSGSRGVGTQGGHGLATHHEGESPAGTPTKPTTNTATRGSEATTAQTGSGEDVGTPGIEILGAVPFPEGGPGGYLASKERRASASPSSASATGKTSTTNTGGVSGVTVAEVFGNVRRESLDAQSAEKALREVSRALEGLGVGVVAAGAGNL
ncbi:hypothetical protein QFC21_005803 [Naganishia friedmannii]|uniref:Uncharacterized protein n=1 Tax=Naganishia friedmannii TaxID=89922 RepID=A0ACC2V7X5_9TREE|nr:hypothetical protein QFC21_005803 [Naganishia friedmannii]